jgi:LacI family transcriptional regulator
MEKKNITVKDLAKILGVSISTVSKALNDSHEISKTTKKKIQETAKQYNYTPNKLASSLKSGKTRNIGVIIPSIKNRFFARVLFGIDSIATKENYSIITCISNESFKKEVTNVQVLANGSIDGFIVALAEETQIKQDFNHFNEAISQGKPIVMFDRVSEMIACDKVIVDDFQASYEATKHMIHSNCKNIALISTINHVSVGKLRVEGYKKALNEFFHKINPNLIVIADSSTLENMIVKLFQNQKVDGVLAIDEDASLATLKIAKSKGYKIPNELSIIGYANEKIAIHVTPELTTINQHGVSIGEAAAKILIDKLENNTASFEEKIIKSTLIERNSTKVRNKNL